jgi:hypothetical protein
VSPGGIGASSVPRRDARRRAPHRLISAARATARTADLVWRALLAGAAGLCVGAGAAAAFGRTGTATSLVLFASVLAVLGLVLGLLGLAATEPVDLRDAQDDPHDPRPLDHLGLESTS